MGATRPSTLESGVRPTVLLVTFGSVFDPRHGIAVRARYMAEAAADLGLGVSVISHEEPPGAHLDFVQTLHVLKRPLRLGWSVELARAVGRLAPPADVLVVESAMLLPAVLAGRPRVPIVWDTTECETLHYSRLSRTVNNRARLFVWRLLERWAVRRTDVVVAVSEAEAGWWARLFPAAKTKLAVIDHRSLTRPAECADARRELEQLCGGRLRGTALLFVGNLGAKHNAAAAEWLARELAPALPADYSLVLAGPGTESVDRHDGSRAQFFPLGGVPDIGVVIAAADACLAPLAVGAGVKTKVLDYLAHGKKVFATPAAMEGIEDAPGVHVAELDRFTERLLDELSTPETESAAASRAESQRAWIRDRHGPERIAQQLRSVLDRVGIVMP